MGIVGVRCVDCVSACAGGDRVVRWGVEWRGGVQEFASVSAALDFAARQSPIGWIVVADESGEWRRFGGQ